MTDGKCGGMKRAELWGRCEDAWNKHLSDNRQAWGIETVGQIESWVKTGDGLYHFFEVKAQEVFEPPPFYGHGLPQWQVDKYIQMQVDLGVVWHLVVFDTGDRNGYQQRLSVLEDGPSMNTDGTQPRKIYSVDSFEKWTDDWTEIVNA